MIPHDYIERLYAGWYGKLIGVRYGAPIEGWTYDAIREICGELNGYIVDYKDFAADDDTNGPMFFLRALEDYGLDASAEQMGRTWLNYTQENKGFFWWGGYGMSTEHTAYLNLKNGIPAPRSGSILQNGATVAEQIGAQIFIDSWGLVAPGNPDRAAMYARRAASVSHDGNAIHGAMFVATAISLAFVKRDIYEVIEEALKYAPEDSEYARMARDVMGFWRDHPENWRDGFQFVKANYGYDRYPGACHIIPNAAVMLLSMLYGAGDFERTINICNMCGWDTDCNVGNVGTILGTLVGLEGIDRDKWIKPINDFFCASSAIGSLNIMDVPWCVSYMARLAYRIADQQPPAEWAAFVKGDAPKYGFDLPGSTHGFRTRASQGKRDFVLSQTNGRSFEGQGCLSFYVRNPDLAEDAYLYVKTFYHPSDFHDSRYDPGFSPTLYPGETVSCRVTVPDGLSELVTARMYVRDEYEDREIFGEPVTLVSGEWTCLSLTIPAGRLRIGEAGVAFRYKGRTDRHGGIHAYVDSFDFSGKSDFTVDFSKEKKEVWNFWHTEIGQMTTIRGIWTIEEGQLHARCSDYAEGYAGRYDFEDYEYQASLTPVLGEFHQLNFRVQGAARSYGVAFACGGKLQLNKNDCGYRALCGVDFAWEPGKAYDIRIVAEGARFVVFVDGEKMIEYTDADHPYLRGQVGVSVREGSYARVGDLKVKVLK